MPINNIKVNTEWTTSKENDNDYFVVERSKNGVDFIEISKQKSRGNSIEKGFYNFTDLHPFQGVSYSLPYSTLYVVIILIRI